jgi:hypothetical protein
MMTEADFMRACLRLYDDLPRWRWWLRLRTRRVVLESARRMTREAAPPPPNVVPLTRGHRGG